MNESRTGRIGALPIEVLPRLRLVPLGEMPTPRACPRLVLTPVPTEPREVPGAAAPGAGRPVGDEYGGTARVVRPVDEESGTAAGAGCSAGDGSGAAAGVGRLSGGRMRPGRAVRKSERTRASAKGALFQVGRHSGGRGVMGLWLMAVIVVVGPRMVSAARRWTSRRTSRRGGGGRDAAR